MFSTSISAVLFALLVVVLQAFTAVSVLPTSTATTNTITGTPTMNTSTSTITMNASAQPQGGQASGSSRNSNNNNCGHRNIAPPNNTTTLREFAVRSVLSWFYKRDNSENQEHNNNVMSLGEILAIVIAGLTLLVAMIPLFRCSRFHRWASSSISPLFRKAPGITPPNPASAPATTTEGSSAIPAPEIPIPRPVLIYNDYSNIPILGACSNTFLYNQNGITGEDGRVLQREELLTPRRPERTFTYPLT